jgi:hypothetical protein
VGNYRHLKTKDMELSYLQERVLDAMMLLHERDIKTRGVGGFMPEVTMFRGRGICDIIGGKWSTFRKRKVDELIDMGWLTKASLSGVGWCYSLTDAGYSALYSRVGRASAWCVHLNREAMLQGIKEDWQND